MKAESCRRRTRERKLEKLRAGRLRWRPLGLTCRPSATLDVASWPIPATSSDSSTWSALYSSGWRIHSVLWIHPKNRGIQMSKFFTVGLQILIFLLHKLDFLSFVSYGVWSYLSFMASQPCASVISRMAAPLISFWSLLILLNGIIKQTTLSMKKRRRRGLNSSELRNTSNKFIIWICLGMWVVWSCWWTTTSPWRRRWTRERTTSRPAYRWARNSSPATITLPTRSKRSWLPSTTTATHFVTDGRSDGKTCNSVSIEVDTRAQ